MPSATAPQKHAKRTFAPSEVAWVTCTSIAAVNTAVDRKEVKAVRAPTALGESPRALGLPALLYLSLRKAVAGTLSAVAKRDLYEALVRREPEFDARLYAPSTRRERLAVPLAGGLVTIEADDVLRSLAERLAVLARAHALVAEDPSIRGGEPTVRGTRIPVHMLADLARKGASREELLRDYPALSPESLEAALAYSEICPRRGRPKSRPWRKARPG